METKRVKRFVTVNADYMADGSVCPHSVILDGQQFMIERIVKVEAIQGSGSSEEGRRFHIVVLGKEASLFLAKERWYVGQKVLKTST